MPLRNRVTPFGELIATSERGLVYGNRGCLHDAEGNIRRRYNGRRWIACQLRFRDRRRRPLMAPGRYTELFFLDEATALAAGHRPCAECRRADYEHFTTLWSELHPGQRGADAIDAQLHRERLDVHRTAAIAGLPDGVMIVHDGAPALVLKDELLRWSPAGYDLRTPRPTGRRAPVITPPSLVATLRHGWTSLVPLIHPTAQ